MTLYQDAIQTKGAKFRLVLTDHRGRVTKRTTDSPAKWLAASNKALHASTERRTPRYVRCESICILPSGEEVPCGMWTQSASIERPPMPRTPQGDTELQALAAAFLAGVR